MTHNNYLKKNIHLALASVSQLIRVLSHTPKGCGFNFWSRHVTSRFQVQFPVGAHMGGNQSIHLKVNQVKQKEFCIYVDNGKKTLNCTLLKDWETSFPQAG